MAPKNSSLQRFWNELKRRKTARVIVTYAATAFILLQLTDILTPALLLPVWTTRLVTFLLIIGFPVAVIFSWVFDITPQGITKTKPSAAVKHQPVKPSEPEKRKLSSEDIVVAVLLVLVIILAYPKIFGTGKNKVTKDPDGKISIAVNTFDNLSGDTILNSWKQGITELLIYNLGTSQELEVQNSQTMFEVYQSLSKTQNASVVPSLSREAALKLKAGNYITGNFQKTGSKIRIIAKLIDTESDKLLWTGKVDGDLATDYIDLTDSLSKQVKDFLEIKALEKNTSLDFREAFTHSADAYRKYIEGTKSLMNGDFLGAIELFKEAYRIDTTFALAAFYVANANNLYASSGSGSDENCVQAAKWTRISYNGKERLPEDYQKWVEMWWAWYITRNPGDVLKQCALLENSKIKSRYYWYDLAVTYQSAFKMWDKSSGLFRKIETINKEWGDDWKYPNYYRYYADAMHETGNHKKETELYETGLKLFPDNVDCLWGEARCAIATGDTAKSRVLTDRLLKIGKKLNVSAITMEYFLGLLYNQAKSPDKAEEHLRRSLSLDPGRADSKYNLAVFLINSGRDVNEGMDLINATSKISPPEGYILWSKGNGYYSQGKYKEAFELLQMVKDRWLEINIALDRDLQKAKEAAAGLK